MFSRTQTKKHVSTCPCLAPPLSYVRVLGPRDHCAIKNKSGHLPHPYLPDLGVSRLPRKLPPGHVSRADERTSPLDLAPRITS